MISTVTISVRLPYHLRTLARVKGEVKVEIGEPATLRSVLDSLESNFPMLRGTIRDHVTKQRRAYVRFFAAGVDLSHESPDVALPEKVVTGEEPLIVLGAIAGG